jgi:prepilin peptidase CpaA
LCAAFALTAGITDLRWRKIPNWLTYPAAPAAIMLHYGVAGRHAALLSMAGAALGLAVLLPFVLLRVLGGGDWKLIGGLGAFLGIHRLIPVLFLTLIINAVMALVLVLWRRRFRETAGNLWQITSSMFLRLPPAELTIDNPETAKVPFGIAAAIAVLLYVAAQQWIAF